MPEPITSFTGEHEFLSTFSRARIITPDGWAWDTAEHCFQAAKGRAEMKEWIRQAPTPAEAKRRGRMIELYPDWDQVRRAAMLQVQLWKFTQNTDLAEKLAATGDASLVEGNSWGDTFWGAVPLRHDYRYETSLPVWAGMAFHGHNWLGRTLMMVREVIR